MPDTLRRRKRISNVTSRVTKAAKKQYDVKLRCFPLVSLLFVLFTICSILLLKRKISPYDNIHFVVSTGCSAWQNWESEVLLFSWFESKQNGSFTRIVAGCKSEKERLFAMKTAVESDRVEYFFTEDYENSPFWNKAFGFHEWLSKKDCQKDIIVLLEPDMIILQPLQVHLDFSEEFVSPGKPIAAKYGFGGAWTSWKLCNEGDCDLTAQDAVEYYAVGPPYAMHREDWFRLSPRWKYYSAPVWEKFSSIESEMFALAVAAAELGLRFRRQNTWMISNPNMDENDEGWGEIPDPGPKIIHYCHRYEFMGNEFSKYDVPHEFMSDCSIPLLDESDLSLGSNRQQWTLFHIVKMINKAATNWKTKYCPEWDDR